MKNVFAVSEMQAKPIPKCRLTFHPPYLCVCSSGFRVSVLKKPKWIQSLDHWVWMNHYGTVYQQIA